MTAMVGTLIRRLRLERNYSQEGLAKGICAASYLSKIEQGQVEAGPEILERLFAALEVEYCQDPELLRQAQAYLEQYFEARDQDEQDAEAIQWLDGQVDRLRCSAFGLWAEIYAVSRLLEIPDPETAGQRLRELRPMEAQMEPEQLYRYALCCAEAAEDWTQALEQVKKAARQKQCAHVYWALSHLQFYLGQYNQCVDTAEKAYAMGAEEGDLYAMVWSSFLLASCHTERDLDLAEKYYRRAIRLSGRADTKMRHLASYNLGASYLEWGKKDQALYWLERTEDIPGENAHNLLRRQKLAILYADLGRYSEALYLLEEAEKLLRVLRADENWKTDSFGEMLRFAWLLAEGKRTEPEFEQVVRYLYGQENLGFSFRRFYGLYLVELYRSQRRYKDALRTMEEIQVNFPER